MSTHTLGMDEQQIELDHARGDVRPELHRTGQSVRQSETMGLGGGAVDDVVG